MTKHPLQSRTLWFNFLAALFVFFAANMEMFKPLMNEHFYQIFLASVTTINFVIRFFTTQSLSLTPTPVVQPQQEEVHP